MGDAHEQSDRHYGLTVAEGLAGDALNAFQAESDRLRAAILDIDAKATPFGPPIVEDGQEFVRMYLIPAGPLHRALGLVGHTAPREEEPLSPEDQALIDAAWEKHKAAALATKVEG